MAQAPPPDVLYNNALRDYNGARTISPSRILRLHQVLSQHRSRRNCYFYLGEIQFRQGNYQQAAQSYDQVVQNFPTGTKSHPRS